jgi:hypothetical protein
MKGLADALADPAAAAEVAVDMINANGNAQQLSPDGEIARWGIESKLVDNMTASALPIGVPDIKLLQTEVSTYAEIGLFDGIVPDISTVVNDSVTKSVYNDAGKVIWPST